MYHMPGLGSFDPRNKARGAWPSFHASTLHGYPTPPFPHLQHAQGHWQQVPGSEGSAFPPKEMGTPLKLCGLTWPSCPNHVDLLLLPANVLQAISGLGSTLPRQEQP